MSPTEATAILIPVLDRPHRVEPLLANIANATPQPHSVIFAASDEPTISELDRLGANYLRDDGDTWPNRINRLFHATSEPYVFLGADDLLFHRGWLDHAMRTMRGVGLRGDGVVVVNDLHNSDGTVALISRSYIDRESGCIDVPGVVIFPGYDHNYSDTELFATARARGRCMDCPQAHVEHLHPAAGKSEDDAVYRKGRAREIADRDLYRSRVPLWSR